jgi:hypothetical protein
VGDALGVDIKDMQRQMEEEVARVERERDGEVRRQTAAAVNALDFELAARIKNTLHADYQESKSKREREREREDTAISHT